MDQSINRFVLRYAPRETAWLVVLTLASLPIYYASLDIPKNIVNKAIIGKGITYPTEVFGFALDQIGYLFWLCAVFMFMVVVNGGVKQFINTLKGRLGERLLRRLRYELVSRVLRFPLSHFRKVSAGEMIPMVTSEVEPLGGYMGDAYAQPLIQAGTLATIVFFLFMQDWIMGLAAISLYPIQAYLIPKLQKRVNQLGKERVRAVRRVSERLGESIAGIHEIRGLGTAPYERSHYADRFGAIFRIRFDIYQRKGLVKFINNLLNQMAPLLFYSIGGWLVIHGDLTIGALTAALAANKDMSAPWKELLDYYQQFQDSQIKYEQVIEQFRPENMVDEALQAPIAETAPALVGPIAFAGVIVADDTGTRLLENVSVEIAPGQRVAVVGPPGGGKDAFALALARLHPPAGGKVTLGGADLAAIPESRLGARVGYVGPGAYIFSASVRDNLAYALKQRPVRPPERDPETEKIRQRWLAESRRAGNLDLDPEADWVDFDEAGVPDRAALDRRLVALLECVDLADDLYHLGLRGRIDPATRPETAAKILAARAAVAERLAEPDLSTLVEGFDPARYNANATLGENLLFGTPLDPAFDVDALATEPRILAILERAGLADELPRIGRQVAETMVEIFADLPAGHELFEQYSFVSAEELAELPAVLGRVGPDLKGASPAERARFATLTLKLVDARHRLGVIDDALKAKVLAARAMARAEIADGIAFFERDAYNRAATLQDNILFGRVAYGQARASARLGKVIAEVLDARDLKGAVLEVGLDFEVGVGGARLSQVQRQKLGLARALVKRPDLLVVNEAIAALDMASQQRVLDGVLAECEGRTVIWVLHAAEQALGFAHVLVFADGRLIEQGPVETLAKSGSAFAEMLKPT